jgi:acetyl esterase
MTITWRMPVLVGRCAKVGVPSAVDPVTRARQQLLRPGGPEEVAVVPDPVDLEPQAKAVVDANANPPYLFELGPDQGRTAVDEVQSGPVKKPTVDIEDTTVPGGPSGQVPVRILRPQGARRPLPVVGYLHGAGWVFGNHHTHDRLIRELAVGAQAAVVFPTYSRSPPA